MHACHLAGVFVIYACCLLFPFVSVAAFVERKCEVIAGHSRATASITCCRRYCYEPGGQLESYAFHCDLDADKNCSAIQYPGKRGDDDSKGPWRKTLDWLLYKAKVMMSWAAVRVYNVMLPRIAA